MSVRMSRSSARVGRRKAQKIPREFPRQDGEIPLHIAGGDPGRLAGELIGSDRKARIATGLRDSGCRTTHAQDSHGRSLSAGLSTPAYFISIRQRENPVLTSLSWVPLGSPHERSDMRVQRSPDLASLIRATRSMP